MRRTTSARLGKRKFRKLASAQAKATAMAATTPQRIQSGAESMRPVEKNARMNAATAALRQPHCQRRSQKRAKRAVISVSSRCLFIIEAY
jgi:hypothetical protein